MELEGLFIPVVTVFRQDDGAVDQERIAAHVRRLLGAGVDGLVALGSTGDFSALQDGEQEQVARTILQAAGGKCPVVVGASALTTRDSLEKARRAETLGAAAVMIAPPFYLPLSDEEILRHYEAISAKLPIPIVLYNNPTCTGQNVTPALIERLARSANLGYVKESSGNIDAFQTILRLTGGRVRVFMGEENLAFQALCLGAQGLIMGLGNGLPEAFRDLLRLTRQGQQAEARALHLRLLRLCEFSGRFHSQGYNSVVKSVMKLRGAGNVTSTRAPFLPLTPDQERELANILAEGGWTGK